MNVAVTGALGYLGVAVCAELRKAGHDVVGLDSGDNARVDGLGGTRVVELDVTGEEAVLATLRALEPDAVVHLAAIPGVDDCDEHPVAATLVNLEGTRNVGTYCRVEGVPLAFASTAGVYHPDLAADTWLRDGLARRPVHYYGRTKRAAEDVLEALATEAAPMVALQKTNLFGEYDVAGQTVEKAVAANFFVDRALAGETIPVHSPGWQARDFLHVLDAADAYRRTVEALVDGDVSGFERFVVGGDDEWTIGDLANHVAERTGASVELVENPNDGPYYSSFTVDNGPFTEWCGWEPKRSLESLMGAAMRAK